MRRISSFMLLVSDRLLLCVEHDGFCRSSFSPRQTDGMVDIWAGCTNFPINRKSSGGYELLETDRNSSFYSGNTGLVNVTSP